MNIVSVFQTSILAFNILMTFANLFIWQFIFRKELKVEKAEKHLKSERERILEHTHKQSAEVLEEALHKSKEIVSKTEHLSGRIEKEALSQAGHLLEDISKEISQKAQKEMDEMVDKNKIVLDIFVNELKDKAVSSHSSLDDSIKKSLNKALQEVEEYKKKKVAEVDADIDRLTVNIAKEFLGKNISLEEHKHLVFESLEQAKKGGII